MTSRKSTEITPENELRITAVETAHEIMSNIENVRAWVQRQLETYEVPSITSVYEFKQAKRDRTSLRNMLKEIEDERKRIKRIYTAHLESFEKQVASITTPIKELDAGMKEAIDAWEDEQKEAKKSRLKEFYEDLAPYIALPLDGQKSALVPFERIFKKSWMLASTSEKQAQEEIEERAYEIAKGESVIRSAEPTYLDDALACYWETLSVREALERSNELTRRIESQRQLDYERVKNDLDVVKGDLLVHVVFDLDVTEEQFDMLNAIIREHEIQVRSIY